MMLKIFLGIWFLLKILSYIFDIKKKKKKKKANFKIFELFFFFLYHLNIIFITIQIIKSSTKQNIFTFLYKKNYKLFSTLYHINHF
jgi:hypothetical protein